MLPVAVACWRWTGTDFYGIFSQDTTDHPHCSPGRLGPCSHITEEPGMLILEPDFPGFGSWLLFHLSNGIDNHMSRL